MELMPEQSCDWSTPISEETRGPDLGVRELLVPWRLYAGDNSRPWQLYMHRATNSDDPGIQDVDTRLSARLDRDA